MLEALGLTAQKNQRAITLSQGQRQRLSLCRLLIEKAPLWLLDEPAAALDDAGSALLKELLQAHSSAGGAALIASHDDIFAPAPTLQLQAA
jgi:heme exporter protein A